MISDLQRRAESLSGIDDSSMPAPVPTPGGSSAGECLCLCLFQSLVRVWILCVGVRLRVCMCACAASYSVLGFVYAVLPHLYFEQRLADHHHDCQMIVHFVLYLRPHFRYEATDHV